MANKTGKRREGSYGQGGLIPPRPGITPFWYAIWRQDGKQYRKSTGETGKMAAQKFLDKKREAAARGSLPEADPSNLHYADLRKLYLTDCEEQEKKSLMHNAETDEAYVCGLKWLDKFFGYEKEDDKGSKVSHITVRRIDEFKAERKAEGAASGTINRALSILGRMFTLAREKGKLQIAPPIKKLPEAKQPRQGFLEVEDYENLYSAFDVEVKNQATGRVTRPYAYVQPLLQTGFYTGMRLGEIMGLKWSNVDLADNVIRLSAGTTKNDEARIIPLIDGLPEMFEKLKRANPDADENDPVFLSSKGEKIGSFIKAWRNACIKAAIKTKINGKEIVSHFEEDGTYQGFLFHDLRRSAIRNLVRAGVSPTVAKAISGHKTDSVFERYNITSEEDLQDAAAKVTEYLKERRETPRPARTRLTAVR